MKYILALDQGTTSSRAILLNHRAQIVSLEQLEFPQHYPQPGWVEHDAMDIWRTQLACAQNCLRKAGVSASEVSAIGVTNQRETTVVWDRTTGLPIAPAIVWQDRRTAPYCTELQRRGFEVLVREKTGLRIDPYFSATKIRWILDRVPGARARAERGELAFGTIDTWLIWKRSAFCGRAAPRISRTAGCRMELQCAGASAGRRTVQVQPRPSLSTMRAAAAANMRRPV